MMIWDDHEVDNDYADAQSRRTSTHGNGSSSGGPPHIARTTSTCRCAAAPIPTVRTCGSSRAPTSEGCCGCICSTIASTARPRPARKLGRGGARTTEPCPELLDPARTLLGPVQEAWLEDGLLKSRAAFNLIAQQTLVGGLDMQPGPGTKVWTDGWTGYPAARRRFLEGLHTTKASNPVVVGGDVHAFFVTDLRRDPDDPSSPLLATEIVGAGVTSETLRTEEQLRSVLADNPHVRFGDVTHRGYVRLEVAPSGMRAEMRAVGDVTDARSPVTTLRSFHVEAGRPGALPA